MAPPIAVKNATCFMALITRFAMNARQVRLLAFSLPPFDGLTIFRKA